MLAHVRANLWLLVLTLAICCVLYPAAVWVVGQVCFHNQAQGSLIDANGQPTSDEKAAVGSRLVAQAFNSAVFFQPRPSAASYNAAASGGSNLGASSPKLRGRVAQLLGTIARYSKAYFEKHKKPDGSAPVVQDDIEKWFQNQAAAKRDVVTDWVSGNPTLAAGWATSSDPIKGYITQWATDHPDVIAAWKGDNKDVRKDPGPDDLVAYFFKSYVQEHPGTWPVQEQETDKDGKQQTIVKPDAVGADIQAIFFDTWLTERVNAKELDPLTDFDQVPADMVTTSGSGLDPDITLRNARYQEDGVVAANRDAIIDAHEKKNNAKATDAQKNQAEVEVRKVVDRLLEDQASRPMFGLMGDERLVNVLQLNLSLKAEMAKIQVK